VVAHVDDAVSDLNSRGWKIRSTFTGTSFFPYFYLCVTCNKHETFFGSSHCDSFPPVGLNFVIRTSAWNHEDHRTLLDPHQVANVLLNSWHVGALIQTFRHYNEFESGSSDWTLYVIIKSNPFHIWNAVSHSSPRTGHPINLYDKHLRTTSVNFSSYYFISWSFTEKEHQWLYSI
jgi:hypothetical protein